MEHYVAKFEKKLLCEGMKPEARYAELCTKARDDAKIAEARERRAEQQTRQAEHAAAAKAIEAYSDPKLQAEGRRKQQRQLQLEAAVAANDGQHVLAFEPNEGDEQRMERLLALALTLGHPALDAKAVQEMRGKVKSGAFTAAQYVDLWCRVLERDCAVTIVGKRKPVRGTRLLVTKRAAAAEAAARRSVVLEHGEPSK
eukprot:SAG11_NODE_2060_length_3874_cov_1.478146_3_plen_198_part_01